MGVTTKLGIHELADGQTQAFVTVNDAIIAIENATNGIKDYTTVTGSYFLPAVDFIRFRHFKFSAITADAVVTLPTTINTNALSREVVFQNSTAFKLTIAGTPNIVIPAASSKIIRADGATRSVVGEFGVITSMPHSVAMFVSGSPVHDTEVLRYVFTENVEWVANFVGSRGSVRIAPSPGARYYCYKNGTKIGDIIVSTGGLFTFQSDAIVAWAPGDVLTVEFQALETGTITFSLPADTADTVTINDGVTSVTFTFGGGGGQVAPGGTAIDSASNLLTAIVGSALSSTIVATRSSNVLTIVNLLPAGGGAITKSDADNDYVIVDFLQDTTSADYGVTMNGTRT